MRFLPGDAVLAVVFQFAWNDNAAAVAGLDAVQGLAKLFQVGVELSQIVEGFYLDAHKEMAELFEGGQGLLHATDAFPVPIPNDVMNMNYCNDRFLMVVCGEKGIEMTGSL